MNNCSEFVNFEEIGRGLSPFNHSENIYEAVRIMRERMQELIEQQIDFAFETTLTRTMFLKELTEAEEASYERIMLFFYLNDVELSVARGKSSHEGITAGHLPGETFPDLIVRNRCYRGLNNFFGHYKDALDTWMFIDNSGLEYREIAHGSKDKELAFDTEKWNELKLEYGG